MDFVNEKMDALGAEMDKFPIFQKLEDATNCKKEYFGAAIISLLLVLLFTGLAVASLICNLGGFVYPAYASFQAIESPGSGDDTQWLIYWLVFSGLSIVELLFSFFISYIPFYFVFKLLLLVWCYHPRTQGAKTVYGLVLNFVKKQAGSDAPDSNTRIDQAANARAKMAAEAKND